jgi:hypothetical protein
VRRARKPYCPSYAGPAPCFSSSSEKMASLTLPGEVGADDNIPTWN